MPSDLEELGIPAWGCAVIIVTLIVCITAFQIVRIYHPAPVGG
jgi:hypothetical protein